ncbi:MAG: O-methyltransferase [Bacteroidales bacterium]|nr:O-methyltransferase [Bacteroidales bacterium]
MKELSLDDYLEKHTSRPSELLQEMIRLTNLRTRFPRMLSGHIQGKFLEMVSKMLKPERILEIGTFTGYSALSLAEGLRDGGKLITIEYDEEYEDLIRYFIEKSGFGNKIQLLIGDAKTIIPDLSETFDLVFIDADKNGYPVYYEQVMPKVRTGGIILVDNVLWSGKVLKAGSKDAETAAIVKFNSIVADDVRVEQVLLPMRDGLMMIRKL